MSGRHVLPEGLALFAAGKLAANERAEVERHVADCPTCAAAHRRVTAARAAMDAIGEAPAPELNWDRLGARLNWTVSSELRRREREQESGRWGGRGGGSLRRLVPFALTGVAIAAAAVAVVLWARGGGESGPRQATPTPTQAPAAVPAPVQMPPVPVPVPAPATPLEGVVTLLAGDVTLDGAPITPGAAIKAGGWLVTGNGRLGVQFGERSGFVLEPHTSLILASFDDRRVELAVEGTVVVELARRRSDQHFAVTAGTRAVEVRGTVFRVAASAGALDVVCTRGRVAVVEGAVAVEVPAGSRLALAKAAPLDGATPALIDADAFSLRVPALPGFLDATTLRAQSAVLAVAAGKTARVRVDGVEVGVGPVFVRATPGRHLVEVGAASRWLEVEAGGTVHAMLTRAVQRSERPGQVDDQLEKFRGDLTRCGDRVRLANPKFRATIEIVIGIDAEGNQGFANIKGSDEPGVEECVRRVVDRFTFPPGSSHEVSKTIRF